MHAPEDVGKTEFLHIVGGTAHCYYPSGKLYGYSSRNGPPFNPVKSLFNIYPKDIKISILSDSAKLVFIAAQFRISR